MTDDELDEERAEEAWRIVAAGTYWPHRPLMPWIVAARLAREGWTPPDSLLAEARRVIEETAPWLGLDRDGPMSVGTLTDITLAALKRGMELAKP